MNCASCGTVNDAGRKFCMECGARLAAGCPACGAQNPPNAKFCGECGASLAGPAAVASAPHSGAVPAELPAPTGASERRLVSVLFADLVGFTTLSENEDPEDTREFLTRYFELARTVVERYGGTIEKFIGDAVMAVWGTPTTHEDDAERAVRAALELVAGVPILGEGRGVAARAGVLTGQAAVTVGATGQGMVAGDLVNTASRLQSVAPAGSVLVGESTFRSAGAAIRFEEAGEQLLKGKTAPVPAWRASGVVGLRRGTGRSEALEPPFVGRDDELRLLKELFHATEREHRARMVKVVGQGGIGKSRLAWEFEKYLDGVVDQVWWHSGRSPAYGEGISYWALAEMVRGRAGIADSDEASAAAAKLHDAVLEWLADEQERRWVEPRLAGLLALEAMPSGSRDELFAAWRTFFERIAERGPTVLVFEDLQWADEGMLDFVSELLERSRNLPFFVVVLARPELNERRPGWGSELRSLSTMALDPLPDADMVALVRGTVPGIPDSATTAIAQRAEGVPLYAVETIRMLLDRGDLRAAGEGRYDLTGNLEGLAVPDTLQALIAARLDALGETDRRLVQTAAVVGQSFTLDAIAAVTGASASDLPESLSGLVKREILHLELDPRSPERGQYQFVQAVVREVAEASLSRSDRRALHLASARYYESLGDDELAGVQASHYLEAYKATPAGPEASALAAQARVSLRAAAERAIALHSNRQAVAYLEQALAVTDDPLDQAALHDRVVEPALNESMFETAIEHARVLEALSRERADRSAVLHAVTLQASVEMSHHRERAAIGLLRPALAEFEGMEPSAVLVSAQGQLARALMVGESYAEALEWADRALANSAVSDDRTLTDILITKGTALIGTAGRTVEGEILLRGAMQIAERSGDIWAALRARNNVLGALEDQQEALAIATEGYATASRYGMLPWVYQFAHVALTTSLTMGDWDAWVEETAALQAPGFYGAWRMNDQAVREAFRGRIAEARRLLEALRGSDLGSSQGIAASAGVEAAIEFTEGNWEAAMQSARRSWAMADASDFSCPTIAAAAAAANRPDWARESLEAFNAFERRGRHVDGIRHGLEAVVAMLEQNWPEARAAYAAAHRDLTYSSTRMQAALIDLAVGTRGAGHMPEAGDALTSAREFFRSVGAERFPAAYEAAAVEDDATQRATPAVASVPNAAT